MKPVDFEIYKNYTTKRFYTIYFYTNFASIVKFFWVFHIFLHMAQISKFVDYFETEIYRLFYGPQKKSHSRQNVTIFGKFFFFCGNPKFVTLQNGMVLTNLSRVIKFTTVGLRPKKNLKILLS